MRKGGTAVDRIFAIIQFIPKKMKYILDSDCVYTVKQCEASNSLE
jgi:hypothetical protein